MIPHSWRFAPMLAALMIPGVVFAHENTAHLHTDPAVTAPEIVRCTLENGAAAECYKLTVPYKPEALKIGPFCPETVADTGGIWEWDGDKSGLYRVDGDFLRMLDQQGFRFFDADGTVHVVDTVSRRPQASHACINVTKDATVTMTMLIPVNPVMADHPTTLGTVSKVGVAANGVPIFSDAPSVLMTGHMPALDVCGGHVDPGGWYHLHANSTDIATVFAAENVEATCDQPQDASALFGYAFDGFAILGSREPDGSAPVGLDQCGGHVGAMPGEGAKYHYHTADTFPNLPGCLVGLSAQGNFVTTATEGIGAANAGPGGRGEPPRPGAGGRGMPPGFDQAAQQLGVTPDALFAAMEAAGGPRADLGQVARALGVQEADLRQALPPPPHRR